MRAPLAFAVASMLVDHLPHPDRLAAEIEIIGAGGRAGRDQFVAVELVGSDRGDDAIWSAATIAFSDAASPASATISGVSAGAPIASRTDSSLSRLRPAIAHFELRVVLVLRGEIFGDELTGEAGCAIDDDVEFRRRLHIDSLR